MITREQIFRALQTIAVPLIVAYVARQLWGEPREEVPKSFYQPLLADIDFVPRRLPVTFRSNVSKLDSYERVSVIQDAADAPDTTAVIMNWSRFPNVMLITSLLCSPWLDNTIAQVFIWNNSPRRLKYEDDDYLVRSEIIQSLRARIGQSGGSKAIHLLPPHEHLSTTLREIHVKTPEDTHLADVHTSFAWLGHGTILHRSEAQQFLSLLWHLKVTDDEMKMADNFFTVLSNRIPEVWFDQGFELGGGQPFTAGSEGDERNKNYTLRATRYLESLTHCGRASCDAVPDTVTEQARPSPPYVTLDRSHAPNDRMRAACRGSACVLETNIRLLPDNVSHTALNVSDILALERRNRDLLSASEENYVRHPPSNAVDMLAETVFRSLTHATKGDMLSLDVLTDVSDAREWTAIELVWLVNLATEDILKACAFEWSSDGVTWHSASQRLICYDTDREAAIDEENVPLRECSVQMLLGSSVPERGGDHASGLRYRIKEKISNIDAERGAAVSPFLVDSFKRQHNYLRISLTERCNLRCASSALRIQSGEGATPPYECGTPRGDATDDVITGFYCMPSEGVELSPPEHILTDDEVIRLATLFVQSGVTKIRLTGGEPTVRKGIVDIVGRLNELRKYGLQSIGMTTNGIALHRKLPLLIENGLTHLNISLDTLDPFKFEIMTRRMGHDAVLRSLETALRYKELRSVKLNVVVVQGMNDHEVLDFVEMTKERRLSVRFIEFMPFTGNKWDKHRMVPSADLLTRIRSRYPAVCKAPDELNDTARSYIIPGHAGSFGFISSMSDHFCGSCNRLRLTADGQIKVCLFDAKEISLRDQMRAGADDSTLLATIGRAVMGKKEKHAGMEDIDVVTNRPMILIGG
ncbi:hypothetical protein ACG7TL_000672 [Trametes sanguinea]